MNFIIFYCFSSKNRFFWGKNPKSSKFRFFPKKVKFSKKKRKTSNCFKSRIFEIWTRIKNLQRDFSTKNRFLKTSLARAKTTLPWDFPKWPHFGRPARNFEWCARGSVRAPKIFWNSKSSDDFVPPSYLWFFHISWIDCYRAIWKIRGFGTKTADPRRKKNGLL